MELPKKLFQKYHLRPIKHLGQNFLIDQRALQKIIQAADLSKNDAVLEIGPGLGILTKELTQKAGKVIAIEKDRRMKEILKETLKDYQNIKIVEGDILKIKLNETTEKPCHSALDTESSGINLAYLLDSCFHRNDTERPFQESLNIKNYKLVANLPYYITSPIIRMFLESENPPKQMILLVQKEVAQRICAKPPKMSLLAVSVQFYAKPKIISYVFKKSFWPRPKVDSAIIKITPNTANVDTKYREKEYRERFFKIVRAGFSSPRKQLVNNLSKGLKISKEKIKKILLDCGFNSKARPGNLSAEDWVKLIKVITPP